MDTVTVKTVPAVLTIGQVNSVKDLQGFVSNLTQGILVSPLVDSQLLDTIHVGEDNVSVQASKYMSGGVYGTVTLFELGDFAVWNQTKMVFFSKPQADGSFNAEAGIPDILHRPVRVQPDMKDYGSRGEVYRLPKWAANVGVKGIH